MHIVKRENVSFKYVFLVRIIFVLIALIVSALVMFSIVKINPIEVYKSMWNGAFGTNKRIWVTVRDLMMLSGLAIALTPSYTLKFWNIGAEGQMLSGALGAAFIMINYNTLDPTLAIILMCLLAIISGAICGLIPAIFKVKWGTNETLFTLMMNYIAIRLVAFAVSKWESPPGSNSVGTINIKSHLGWMPNLFSKGFNKDCGIVCIIVLLLCLLMFIYLKCSKHGFEIKVIGESLNTAKYSGILINKVILRTMAISGALCGLIGFLEVSAVSHTITTSSAGGRGFTAIIVAWLAKMNPFYMILISTIITFLNRGAVQIATEFGLNANVSEIVTGIILFFILASEFFVNYKFVKED